MDPLEKLNITKDSTLLMAITAKQMGHKVYFLFEKDFYIRNDKNLKLSVYSFEGKLKADGCYIESIVLTEKHSVEPREGDVIHMRIDPPFDTRYLRYLWMLDFINKKYNVTVTNNPIGIMKYNEKLTAYRLDHAVKSFVGSSLNAAKDFLETHLDVENFIIKPLDLYSGIGVTKLKRENVLTEFPKLVKEFKGAIILQPYLKAVESGEHRSIFYKGKHLGTILKIPKKGEFLANIAQGAEFKKSILAELPYKECEKLAQKLHKQDVDLVAFDVLGDYVTEVNVTCPGLLVEVSYAYGENLAKKLFLIKN
jgi:glutathione synthase